MNRWFILIVIFIVTLVVLEVAVHRLSVWKHSNVDCTLKLAVEFLVGSNRFTSESVRNKKKILNKALNPCQYANTKKGYTK